MSKRGKDGKIEGKRWKGKVGEMKHGPQHKEDRLVKRGEKG